MAAFVEVVAPDGGAAAKGKAAMLGVELVGVDAARSAVVKWVVVPWAAEGSEAAWLKET